jgi:hypothetical protein
MKLKQSTKDNSEKLGVQNSKEFTIDTSNQMIVSILRDRLYENKVAAVCREVSSNSRDANREAGKPKVPVVIAIGNENDMLDDETLFISFKDSGIGISPDRIDNVFLKYGSSTKRDSNKQTGGFGIGAKTPFAYTNEFLIETVSDHEGERMKHVYQAAILNENGQETSQLILVHEEVTNEATGTTIIVPIKSKDREDFEKESIKATMFWDVQPTLEGFIYKNMPKVETLKEGDSWKILYGSSTMTGVLGCNNDSVILQVDGIPYEMPNIINGEEFNDLRDSRMLRMNSYNYDNIKRITVLEFTTGELSLSASREGVESTEGNMEVILERHNKALNQIYNIGFEKYNTLGSDLNKVSFYNTIRNSYGFGEYKNKNFNHYLSELEFGSVLKKKYPELESMPKNLRELGGKKLNFFHVKNASVDPFSTAKKHNKDDMQLTVDVVENSLFVFKSTSSGSKQGINAAIRNLCREKSLTQVFIVLRESVLGDWQTAIADAKKKLKESKVNFVEYLEVKPVRTTRKNTYVKKTKEERMRGVLYVRNMTQSMGYMGQPCFDKRTIEYDKESKKFAETAMVAGRTVEGDKTIVVLPVNENYGIKELDRVKGNVSNALSVDENSTVFSEKRFDKDCALLILKKYGYEFIAVKSTDLDKIKNTKVTIGLKNAMEHFMNNKKLQKDCKVIARKSEIEKMDGFLKGTSNYDKYFSLLGKTFLLLGGLNVRDYKVMDKSKMKGVDIAKTELYQKASDYRTRRCIHELAEIVVEYKKLSFKKEYKGYINDDVIERHVKIIKEKYPAFHYIFEEQDLGGCSSNWHWDGYDTYKDMDEHTIDKEGMNVMKENLYQLMVTELTKLGIQAPKKRGRKKKEEA